MFGGVSTSAMRVADCDREVLGDQIVLGDGRVTGVEMEESDPMVFDGVLETSRGLGVLCAKACQRIEAIRTSLKFLEYDAELMPKGNTHPLVI